MDIRVTLTRHSALFQGITTKGQLWLWDNCRTNAHLIAREHAEDFIEAIKEAELTVED